MRKFFVGCSSLIFLAMANFALAGQIDINTADAVQLAQGINGVGVKRAEAIIAYRKQHGPFKSVDDLTKVKGIDAKIVEQNRPNLSVGTK